MPISGFDHVKAVCRCFQLKMDFSTYLVPDLKIFLQKRGVTCYFHRRDHLLRLCELSVELKLDVIDESDNSDYVQMDIKRRTVHDLQGNRHVLKPVNEVEGWTKNLAAIPNIESCDVMIYLMNTCGWSDTRLRRYRYDDGYQLYTDCHISNTMCCQVLAGDTRLWYIKSSCIPQTRQNETPYTVWILLTSNGEITSGGCTCVADNGTCKHCVALLFAVADFCDRHRDRHTETCTDIECAWDKPKKSSNPIQTEDIDIRRKDRLSTPFEEVCTPIPSKFVPNVDFIPEDMKNVEKEMYMLFKGTNALVLQTLDPPSDEQSDSSENEEMSLASMKDAIKLYGDVPLSAESISDHLKSIYTVNVVEEIEYETRGQASNQEWYNHRHGRVTASVIPSVMHFRFTDKPDNYILKKIINISVDVNAPSSKFGRDHEPVARQHYFEKNKPIHRSLKVEECGLFIDVNYPYMGASPDGVVSCKCCGNGLLEIKCSYTYRDRTPLDACMDDHYHIYCDENNNIKLKTSSPWYTQIQCQLGVCKRDWCDFVIYTKKEIAVDRIYFDSDMYRQMSEKALKFFTKYVIPSLHA